MIILVQAGKATDAVIDGLVPLLDQGDIIIDGGNALWTDTIRREKALKEKGLRFVGSGVSGGEEGARFGPSLMPGGDKESWNELKPIWTAIAAKVDRKTGRPLTGRQARPADQGRRALHHVHRRERRRPLREDGAQRHRVRRHADDL
jgi:6-phosphogluconate dehydrogenase